VFLLAQKNQGILSSQPYVLQGTKQSFNVIDVDLVSAQRHIERIHYIFHGQHISRYLYFDTIYSSIPKQMVHVPWKVTGLVIGHIDPSSNIKNLNALII
jgi:hypothetical protein